MSSLEKINLVIVAHPDDEVLGFGGTGAKLVQHGEKVQAIILCGNVDARTMRPSNEELHDDLLAANRILGFEEPILGSFPNIRMNNVDHIKVVQFIENQMLRLQPARVFTHHPGDLNDDHVHVSRATMVASRYCQRRSDIRQLESLSFVEILSSTDWSYPMLESVFLANTYSGIENQIDLKIEALKKYRNVMRDFPHPRSIEILRGYAAYRGGQCGMKYAEAFQAVFKLEV